MAAQPAAQPDPFAIIRSRGYVGLLVIAAILGVPISAAAYGFLALVGALQKWVYSDLPMAIGFHQAPLWWPVPLLAAGGVLVGLAIRHLPGTGGHPPADAFEPRVTAPAELPGMVLAALASLVFGAVLGPEAPLIALGGGLAVSALRLFRRDLPPMAGPLVGSAGSFAAVSTLLGSPLLGAFLLMEASGLGGPMLGLALVPGLLAAGVGYLIFVGLDVWSGLGTFSLEIPGLPGVGPPGVAEFGWALVIGLAAAPLGSGIRWLALRVRPRVEGHLLVLTPAAGVAVAGLAILYAASTGKASSDVLFSGQAALGPLIANAAGYPVGTLALLVLCKGLAYGISLGSFRGGPVFPAMFVGAAGGVALSHLPGLPVVAAVGMGIGAMSVVMLRLPLTSVLLATLLLLSDGLAIMPLVIVAVAVAYVASARFVPAPAPGPEAAPGGPAVPPERAPGRPAPGPPAAGR